MDKNIIPSEKIPLYKKLYDIYLVSPQHILQSSKRDKALEMVNTYKNYIENQQREHQKILTGFKDNGNIQGLANYFKQRFNMPEELAQIKANQFITGRIGFEEKTPSQPPPTIQPELPLLARQEVPGPESYQLHDTSFFSGSSNITRKSAELKSATPIKAKTFSQKKSLFSAKDIDKFNQALFQSVENILTDNSEGTQPLKDFFEEKRIKTDEGSIKRLLVNIAEGLTTFSPFILPFDVTTNLLKDPIETLGIFARLPIDYTYNLITAAGLNPIQLTLEAMGNKDAIKMKQEARKAVFRDPVGHVVMPIAGLKTVKSIPGTARSIKGKAGEIARDIGEKPAKTKLPPEAKESIKQVFKETEEVPPEIVEWVKKIPDEVSLKKILQSDQLPVTLKEKIKYGYYKLRGKPEKLPEVMPQKEFLKRPEKHERPETWKSSQTKQIKGKTLKSNQKDLFKRYDEKHFGKVKETPLKPEEEIPKDKKKTREEVFTGTYEKSAYSRDYSSKSNLSFISQLPEIVDIAKIISEGEVPSVYQQLRKNVLGYAKDNKIVIASDIAAGHILETHNFKSKSDIEKIKNEFFNKNPDLKGKEILFKIHYKRTSRTYTVNIIQVDPTLLPRVLAHELGHVLDYIPEKTVSRGNILGRIASFTKYFKKTLPEKPGQSDILTAEDRARLKNLAKKLLLEEGIEVTETKEIPIKAKDILSIWNDVEAKIKEPELHDYIAKLSKNQKISIVKEALKGKVPDWVEFKKIVIEKKKITGKDITPEQIKQKYHELIQEELKKRKIFDEETILNELKELTQVWKPFDPEENPAFTKYRFSSKELYADAISVLLNNPDLLKEKAPTFYQAFFNWLDNKPKFNTAYKEYQNLLSTGSYQIFKTRKEKTYQMFEKGEQTRLKKMEKKRENLWESLMENLVTKGFKIYRDVGKNKSVLPEENPYYWYELIFNSTAIAKQYVRDIENNVFKVARKYDISKNDIGYYMLLLRTSTERKYLANPNGYDFINAEKDIRNLHLLLGNKKFEILQDIVSAFVKARMENIIPWIENARMLSPEGIQYIKDNRNYFTFSVSKYLKEKYNFSDNTISGIIHRQFGTFEDIENPLYATILKDLSIVDLCIRQIAAKKMIAFYQNPEFKTEQIIEEAKKDSRGLVKEINNSEVKTMILMYDGEIRGYYLPAPIVDAFNATYSRWGPAVRILGFLNRPFKEIWVGKNPFWAVLTNLPRDFIRTWKLNPEISLFGLLKEIAPAFKDSYMDVVKNVSTPFVREMYKSMQLPAYRQWTYYQDPSETILDNIFKMYSMDYEKSYSIFKKPFIAFGKALKVIPEISERVPNIAGARALKRKGVEGILLTHRSLTRVGSPYFQMRGYYSPLVNNISLFFTAKSQGWFSTVEAIRESPKTYFYRTAVWNIASKVMMFLGASGILVKIFKAITDDPNDEEYAKWFEKAYSKIPEYDMANYVCIPIGETPTRKIVYIIQPQDFGGKIFSGIFWKLLNYEKDFSPYDIIRFLNGEMPWGSLSPIIKVFIDSLLLLSGKNIWDSYRGEKAIPEEEFNAGWKERIKAFFRYEWNQYGGYYIYHFDSDKLEIIQSDLEKLLGKAVIGQGLRRFIRVSDRGEVEKFQKKMKEIRILNNRKNLKIKREIVKWINDGLGSEELAKKIAQLYSDLLKEGYDIGTVGEFKGYVRRVFTNVLLDRANTALAKKLKIANGSVQKLIEVELDNMDEVTDEILTEKLNEIYKIYGK